MSLTLSISETNFVVLAALVVRQVRPGFLIGHCYFLEVRDVVLKVVLFRLIYLYVLLSLGNTHVDAGALHLVGLLVVVSFAVLNITHL